MAASNERDTGGTEAAVEDDAGARDDSTGRTVTGDADSGDDPAGTTSAAGAGSPEPTGAVEDAGDAGDSESSESADGSDSSHGDQDGREGTTRRKRFPLAVSLPATILVAVVLLLTAGGAVTFGLLYKSKVDMESTKSEALSAAREYAVTLTGYDYQDLDASVSDALDGATGQLKSQYQGASKALREMLEQSKTSAKASVVEAAVSSAGPDRVEVLLFVDQEVTNAATDKPRLDANRAVMTMERHGDRWLASKFELV